MARLLLARLVSCSAHAEAMTIQRTLLYDYIKHQKEFSECRIIEKCDNSFFGMYFDNKPSFTEIMELAKNGKINCTIVKDLETMWSLVIIWSSFFRLYLPYLCK